MLQQAVKGPEQTPERKTACYKRHCRNIAAVAPRFDRPAARYGALRTARIGRNLQGKVEVAEKTRISYCNLQLKRLWPLAGVRPEQTPDRKPACYERHCRSIAAVALRFDAPAARFGALRAARICRNLQGKVEVAQKDTRFIL